MSNQGTAYLHRQPPAARSRTTLEHNRDPSSKYALPNTDLHQPKDNESDLKFSNIDMNATLPCTHPLTPRKKVSLPDAEALDTKEYRALFRNIKSPTPNELATKNIQMDLRNNQFYNSHMAITHFNIPHNPNIQNNTILLAPGGAYAETLPYLPIEIVPVPILRPTNTRLRAQAKKHAKYKHKNPTLKHVTISTSPEPIGYIPISLDHPPINPDYLPKTKSPPTVKSTSAPGRDPASEYVSTVLPGSEYIQYHKTSTIPESAKRTGATGTRLPSTFGGGLGTAVPSAPRLAARPQPAAGGPAFASIDPRKLRSQRVSPLIFNRSQLYRLL